MQLILDKTVPPLSCPPISRRRLLNLLSESITCNASTVIQGRAGTGKTLLAADFASRCGRAVAWYTVDASDVDLNIFLRYLAASVARQRTGFASGIVAQLGQSSSPLSLSDLAEAFAYELQKNEEPLLLVIDDLHLIYDADWLVPFFRRLLPLLAAEVHLIIIARSLPPTPLWRLRSKQALRVIDEAALNFTLQEARELLNRYGLNPHAATTALKHTLGRARALDGMAKGIAIIEPSGRTTATPSHPCSPAPGDYT
jgi:LuxR family transcriptional regulator, maltose regulon positive regulatory protein